VAQEAGESAGPPGFWGNREAGRELRTSIRIDQYTLGTGEQSRLEIPGAKI
jgi:putative transposase